MAAGGSAGEAVHVVDVFEGGRNEVGCDGGAGVFGVGGGFFDEHAPGHGILAGVEEDAFGFEAVAAGAAGFLLVGFDGFGHAGVEDEADIGAVDAHAEGDGGDDEVGFFFDEGFLGFFADVGGHAGVVADGFASQ